MSRDLILIDGSALVYRSHYAMARRPLTGPSGEATSVVFGTLNSVLALVERYRPSHLVMVLDAKGPTFRHQMYDQYKANRKPMPDELAEQLPRLRELLAAWGLPVFEQAGFEADDIMATLARRSEGHCEHAWFYTGDKDFQQLLDQRTGMLKPGRRGDEITEVTLSDLDLTPAQIVDCFALAGDKSDNIPGAPGVGDKTAARLIAEYGDLDTLYRALPASGLSPRLNRVLAEHEAQVRLSRELFTIDRDVPLEVDWDGLRTVLPINPDVVALMDRLGLTRASRWAAKLADGMPEAVATPAPAAPVVPAADAEVPGDEPVTSLADRGYVLLPDAGALSSWLDGLPAAAPLAVDTETDSAFASTGPNRCRRPAPWARPAASSPPARSTTSSRRSASCWPRCWPTPPASRWGRTSSTTSGSSPGTACRWRVPCSTPWWPATSWTRADAATAWTNWRACCWASP